MKSISFHMIPATFSKQILQTQFERCSDNTAISTLLTSIRKERPELPMIQLPERSFADSVPLNTLRILITRLRVTVPLSPVPPPLSTAISTTLTYKIHLPPSDPISADTLQQVDQYHCHYSSLFACLLNPLRSLLYSLFKEISSNRFSPPSSFQLP